MALSFCNLSRLMQTWPTCLQNHWLRKNFCISGLHSSEYPCCYPFDVRSSEFLQNIGDGYTDLWEKRLWVECTLGRLPHRAFGFNFSTQDPDCVRPYEWLAMFVRLLRGVETQLFPLHFLTCSSLYWFLLLDFAVHQIEDHSEHTDHVIRGVMRHHHLR